MDGDLRPEDRTSVTIKGVRYDLVSIEKMSFPELRMLKRETLGMTPQQVLDGITEVDPDAWFGWLLVSIHRVDPEITTAKLTAMLGDMSIEELLVGSETEDSGGAAQPDPPTPPPAAAAGSTQNGTESGMSTPAGSTLEMPGTQA